MRVGIIGGGAIGLLLAANLLREKHTVKLYVRSNEQKESLNKDGITLYPERDTFAVSTLLLGELKEEDVLFVCVKQYHLRSLLFKLAKLKTVPLIFLQNGMGHIDLIQEKNFSAPIIYGVTEHGALRENTCAVTHTGRGIIKLAIGQGDITTLKNLISSLHTPTFPILEESNWYRMLSEKLVANAVINPITAIFQVQNGEILSNPFLADLGRRICSEVSDVLGLSPDKQWERLKLIIANTKNNYSSMLKDINEKRETEIEAIVGYIIRNKSYPVPNSEFVYKSVKAIEWKEREVTC